jgi:hypothetical protein
LRRQASIQGWKFPTIRQLRNKASGTQSSSSSFPPIRSRRTDKLMRF